MTQEKSSSFPNRLTYDDVSDLAVTFHQHILSEFEYWAQSCGRMPNELREISERAIRTRIHEAVIEHESRLAHGKQPDIWTLILNPGVQMYFTIERQTVVIRGYGWDLDREPLDDFEAGGFICENNWMPRLGIY